MIIKRLISALLLASLFISLISLSSCFAPRKFQDYSFDYFDTVTTVTGYEKSEEEFKSVSDELFEILEEYHRLFDIYHKYDGIENLASVNSLVDGEHREVKVDRKIIDLLLFSVEIYGKSGGKVNIAMGSVLSIWHNYRKLGENSPNSAKLPPMEKLQAAAQHTDINNLIIDEENSTVRITDPEMTLDVGAVAKGYAVEMAARALEERGITGYIINCGGNIRAIGEKPNGEKWLVGVENPNEDEENPFLRYLNLSSEAMVVSGNYQRYYFVNGKSYHHIIDNETLMPAEGFTSVAVLSASSALADGLSTALFCLSYEEGLALAESVSGIEVLWLFENGEIKTTEGFKDYENRDS